MVYFTDGSSVLIRKSGTEPLIRYYIEGIANDMIESKNLEQPLNETLKSYDVSYNEDGTIQPIEGLDE